MHVMVDAFEPHGRSTVQSIRILVTGGSGVLGRPTIPLLLAEGHDVVAPSRTENSICSTKTPSPKQSPTPTPCSIWPRAIPREDPREQPGAWRENDLLRTEASRLLVDAGLSARASVYVQPTVTFVYPKGSVDEETPIGDVPRTSVGSGRRSRSLRFAAAGRTGVVLRLGLLDGPGTKFEQPNDVYGATLHVDDAARARSPPSACRAGSATSAATESECRTPLQADRRPGGRCISRRRLDLAGRPVDVGDTHLDPIAEPVSAPATPGDQGRPGLVQLRVARQLRTGR